GGFVLQLTADVEALAAFGDEIDEHEIGRRGPAGVERLAAGLHHCDIVPFLREQPFQKPCARLVVVGNENGCAQAHRGYALQNGRLSWKSQTATADCDCSGYLRPRLEARPRSAAL